MKWQVTHQQIIKQLLNLKANLILFIILAPRKMAAVSLDEPLPSTRFITMKMARLNEFR